MFKKLDMSRLKHKPTKIAPKRHPQGKKVFKKLDMSRLKHKPTAEVLSSDVDKKLGKPYPGRCSCGRQNGQLLRVIVYSTALEHLGPSKCNIFWTGVMKMMLKLHPLIVEKNCLLR